MKQFVMMDKATRAIHMIYIIKNTNKSMTNKTRSIYVIYTKKTQTNQRKTKQTNLCDLYHKNTNKRNQCMWYGFCLQKYEQIDDKQNRAICVIYTLKIRTNQRQTKQGNLCDLYLNTHKQNRAIYVIHTLKTRTKQG